VCKVCGTVRSAGSSRPPDYVLSHQLDDRWAYPKYISGPLLLTQELVDQIDWSRFPDARLYPYPVFDRPIDGQRLPGDPDWDALPPVPDGGASHFFGLGTHWEERSLHGPRMIPHRPWLQEAKDALLCRRCGKIDRTKPPRPVDVVVEPWPNPESYSLKGLEKIGIKAPSHQWDPVKRLSRTGVVIFQRDVLDAIGDELAEALIGGVLLPDGTRLDELATCTLPHAVTLEPGRDGDLKSCGRCGARWPGRSRLPGHFRRSDLPTSRVLQDHNGNLYVDALLVPRFHDLTYHGLSVDTVVPVEG